MDRSPHQSDTRSHQTAPASMSDGVRAAQEFVDKSLYHNAEEILDQIVESASIHPEISDEEFDQLAAHYSSFRTEVDSRYTDSTSLQGELDDIEQLLS